MSNMCWVTMLIIVSSFKSWKWRISISKLSMCVISSLNPILNFQKIYIPYQNVYSVKLWKILSEFFNFNFYFLCTEKRFQTGRVYKCWYSMFTDWNCYANNRAVGENKWPAIPPGCRGAVRSHWAGPPSAAVKHLGLEIRQNCCELQLHHLPATWL